MSWEGYLYTNPPWCCTFSTKPSSSTILLLAEYYTYRYFTLRFSSGHIYSFYFPFLYSFSSSSSLRLLWVKILKNTGFSFSQPQCGGSINMRSWAQQSLHHGFQVSRGVSTVAQLVTRWSNWIKVISVILWQLCLHFSNERQY